MLAHTRLYQNAALVLIPSGIGIKPALSRGLVRRGKYCVKIMIRNRVCLVMINFIIPVFEEDATIYNDHHSLH